MKLALDTNRFVDLCRGETEVVRRLEEAEAIFLPFVVLAELRAGFAQGRHGRTNERTLQLFLAKPGVATLFASDDTTRSYAAIFRQLRHQGTPIPTNDIWIAAATMDVGGRLLTFDAHFQQVTGLDIVLLS